MRVYSIRAIVTFGVFVSGSAWAGVITFDDLGLSHGSIVSTQMPGVTISGYNDRTESTLAAVFNTDIETSTADPDLQRNPPGSRDIWSSGNLPPDTHTGLALFIPENTTDDDPPTGVLDDPDDEGARPAGSLYFDFDVPITSFGFDLVDVEGTGPGDEPGAVRYFDGLVLVEVPFSSFMGVTFGDASLNRIAPIALGSPVTSIEIYLGGSGAVDNIVYTNRVPEPGLVALLGLSLLGIAGIRRRKR